MNAETALKYQFETGVYRPPSEGGSHSLLIRVTRNCPWNRCEFCTVYKGAKFSIRPVQDILKDILVKHTGQDMDRITQDTDRDFYLNPQQAVEYGIIDEILTKPSEEEKKK